MAGRTWRTGGAVLALTVVVGFTPAGAVAATSDEARQRAEAAAREVDRLSPRVDAALRAYEAALTDLASGLAAGVAAERTAAEAAAARSAVERAAAQRVRALYMTGGQTGLLASVLDAQSPSDLAHRIGTVRRVVDADRRLTEAATAEATRTQTHARETIATTDATSSTVGTAQARLADLTALLDQAQAQLDRLDERARRLAEAERAAAAVAAARAAADSAQWAAASTATARGIPVTFLALYRAAAATCPGLPWPVLAAIGQVESGHGTNPNDSPAGAQGPMQFMPATFAAYGVDGDGDGRADIRNPADAVHSAARYLCANGAGKSDGALRRAIYRYNHANWYIAMVLRVATQIAERFGEPAPPPYEPVV